ncbi:hypothetical protein [uncultured Cedecea sp.]|nr:hypothetical protein [uncultured Cedecea sp.]
MNKKLNIVTGLLVMLYPLGLDLYLVIAPEHQLSYMLTKKKQDTFLVFI